MTRLGLDFISGLGMPPVDFVELAAGFGCGGITLALAPFTANPHGYPAWSLREDAALRRDLTEALAATGIELRNGEGFLIRPASDATASAADLDLMADTMHIARSGSGPAELAALDPAAIGYIQLCDVKHKPLDATYGEEARHNRLALGDGDLPLADLIAALPAGIPIGLELPMLDRAAAGKGPKERLAASVAMAKTLLGEA